MSVVEREKVEVREVPAELDEAIMVSPRYTPRDIAARNAAFIAACSPSVLLALTEVAAKAAEYRDAWENDLGAYEEGQRIVAAREAFDAALARLSVCLSGTQPNNEEGK